MTTRRPKEPAGHDTLVRRLTQILLKLNRGERLDPRTLAAEFGVDVRTVQRDLNQRFAYLDLIKVGGCYQIDRLALGHLSTGDIERFAIAAGTDGLFPTLSHAFVRQLLTEGGNDALLVRGQHYEDVAGFGEMFSTLRTAIAQRSRIGFDFESATSGAPKRFDELEPYRLVNQKGIWYLAATDRGKLKTFGFSRIRGPRLTGGKFNPDPAVTERLDRDEGLWQSDQAIKVVVSVAPAVAHYFRRRKLMANQIAEQVRPDGGLLLSTTIGHPNEILPIVRYWIPHVRIVEPVDLQQSLDAQLLQYAGAGAG